MGRRDSGEVTGTVQVCTLCFLSILPHNMKLTTITRIAREIADLEANPPPYATIVSLSTSVTNIDVLLLGPDSTPYEGGCFYISLSVPDIYPYRQPSVTLRTPIFHPNCSGDGLSICHCVLSDMRWRWAPILNLRDCNGYTVVGEMLELLKKPLEKCQHMHWDMWENDRERFVQTAKEWTQKYAM